MPSNLGHCRAGTSQICILERTAPPRGPKYIEYYMSEPHGHLYNLKVLHRAEDPRDCCDAPHLPNSRPDWAD